MPIRRLNLRLLIAAVAFTPTAGSQSPAPANEAGADAPVVLVCEHGSVKSLIGASIFDKRATERGLPFRAVSRGIAPDASVPPKIAAALRDDGVKVAGYRPQPLTKSDLSSASRVIAIGVDLAAFQDEARAPIELWSDVPPASVDYAASRAARLRHVETLLDELQGAQSTPARESAAPIIDVHVHALRLADFPMVGQPPIPHCVPMTDYPVPDTGPRFAETLRSRDLPCHATWSPATDDEVMNKTIEIMNRRNVFGVLSGGQTARWMQAAPGRFIPSLGYSGGPDAPSLESLRQQFKEGRFVVLGEVTTQYGGIRPDDSLLAPFWALANELDIPVGIHIGTGPVGAPYVGFDGYRARLHSPLTLEEVLIRHPKLRVYIMHAGWPMIDDLLALLWTHPHVYVDTGAIAWILPRAEFHRYLQRIVEAGFGKRVLFGSDQMIWPETVELAIQSIDSATFLNDEQRRDIYFNNAARFLRLTPERIAEMQGKRRD